MFLQPYADPNNPVPIPRALLAQQECNLLCCICSMTQEACALIYDDAMTTASDKHPDGLGYFLSCLVACVVEGLVWQWKAPSSSHFGFQMGEYFENIGSYCLTLLRVDS